MSIRVMSRIWDDGPDDREELLVLLALADFADDAGRCYPSMASVARKARLSERGAQKIVRRLEAAGWVIVETGGGRASCNVYVIRNPEQETPNEKPRTVFTERKEQKPRTGVQETPNTGSPEPSGTLREPSKVDCAVSTKPKAKAEPPGFDAFWASYPRKVAKGAARKAWVTALRKSDAATITAAAGRVEDRGEFTPHPATWLNAERWADAGLAPPKAAGIVPAASAAKAFADAVRDGREYLIRFHERNDAVVRQAIRDHGLTIEELRRVGVSPPAGSFPMRVA